VPRLCEIYPGICLTTKEKARKNLSHGSRRMPVGKEYTEQIMTSCGYKRIVAQYRITFSLVNVNVHITHY
jgi:hypothetical protein